MKLLRKATIAPVGSVNIITRVAEILINIKIQHELVTFLLPNKTPCCWYFCQQIGVGNTINDLFIIVKYYNTIIRTIEPSSTSRALRICLSKSVTFYTEFNQYASYNNYACVLFNSPPPMARMGVFSGLSLNCLWSESPVNTPPVLSC